MVIPGPNEPTLLQLNNIMERFVTEMTQLYAVSDLPASCKIEGLASFSSKFFMCPQCKTPSYYLADPRGFDYLYFKLRDPWCYVQYAFRACSADDADKKEIFDRHGVSWTVINDLPGWLNSVNSVVKFMHCIYLCMVRHLTKVIILQLGMLSSTPRDDQYPLDRLESFFTQIIWPPSVSRLPPSVTSSSSKADQWCHHISVLFIRLFIAWEIDGKIPDIDAPKSRSGTKDTTAFAKTEKVLQQRCLEAFPYEQNNGFLGRTNHNNHKGGELECTMMCKWWKWVLVHDLVRPLQLHYMLLLLTSHLS
ncbi:hypothetical protein EDD22DRAFT_981908 [Suillus occidentalis]|nr:hypothetical protein EDD22DRAFT_981908 [Suillus occidentalis]